MQPVLHLLLNVFEIVGRGAGSNIFPRTCWETLIKKMKKCHLNGISCFLYGSRQSKQTVPFLTPHPLCERYEGEVSGAKGWMGFLGNLFTSKKSRCDCVGSDQQVAAQ